MIETLLNYLWQAWAVVAVICLIAEIVTGGFFIICFAIGGMAATIAALCGAGFYAQLSIFAIVSALSIFGIRPFALKYLHKGKDDSRPSNADALLGREGTVVEDIVKGNPGYVAIDGDVWKSVSYDGNSIAKDSHVKVVGRNSIILTVKPILS
jgi:membrane protein implicated in regulation of membrane protease activity